MFKVLLTVLLSLFSLNTLAAPLPTIDRDRTVLINGPIANTSILSLGERLLVMTNTKRDPVSIVINSPGGSIELGYLFVNYMQAVRARKVTINCYVQHIAASMAFQILLHCDNRYALSHSLLLWHGARIFGVEEVTEDRATIIADDLKKANAAILDELHRTLTGMPIIEVDKHFERQTLHTGRDLAAATSGFIHVYPSIPGLLSINDKNTPSTAVTSIFGFVGHIIYMYEGGLL